MPLLGFGGYPTPTRNLTSDDAKLSLLEGFKASTVNEFLRGLGARSKRSKEREILQPTEEREAKLQQLQGMDPDFFFQRQFFETPDVGETLSAEEATERMEPWGLSYNRPQSEAQLDFDEKNAKAKIRRDNQLARIQRGFLPGSLSLIGGFAGALFDPPTAATLLIPGAPEIKAILAARRASKGLTLIKGSQATLRLGDEAFEVAPRLLGGTKRADFAVGFGEGVAFDLAIEVPNYILAQGLQEEYSIQSLILGQVASGTLTGIIQIPRGVRARSIENKRLKTEFQGLIDRLAAEPSTPRKLAILNRVDFDFLEGENAIALQLRSLAAQDLDLADLGEAGREIDRAVAQMNDQLPSHKGESDLDTPQESLDHDLYYMARDGDYMADDYLDPVLGTQAPRPKKVEETQTSPFPGTQAPRPKKVRGTQTSLGFSKERNVDFGSLGTQKPVPPAEARAAREAATISNDPLATSKRLDEVGKAEGRPEVRDLDRAKHLRKDFAFRMNMAREALGDALGGRRINVDHLMRQAVLMDMNNRGVISDVEYKAALEKVFKSHNADLEAGSAGVFSDPNVELVSSAEIKKGEVSPQRQIAESLEEAEARLATLQDDIDGFEFSPEFLAVKRVAEESTDTLARLETPEGKRAASILADCMGGVV